VIEQHDVCTLFTAPTAFRAKRQQDPNGEQIERYDLSRFRALFLAGERCDPETLKWAEEQLRVSGDRPLLANGDWMAGRGQLYRHRALARHTGIAHQGGARMGPPRPRRRRRRAAGGRDPLGILFE